MSSHVEAHRHPLPVILPAPPLQARHLLKISGDQINACTTNFNCFPMSKIFYQFSPKRFFSDSEIMRKRVINGKAATGARADLVQISFRVHGRVQGETFYKKGQINPGCTVLNKSQESHFGMSSIVKMVSFSEQVS
jgi:hypothetical protein